MRTIRAAWRGIAEFARSVSASEGAERTIIATGTLAGVLLLGALLNLIVAAVIGMALLALLAVVVWLWLRSSRGPP